jgi:hypothetical protein
VRVLSSAGRRSKQPFLSLSSGLENGKRGTSWGTTTSNRDPIIRCQTDLISPGLRRILSHTTNLGHGRVPAKSGHILGHRCWEPPGRSAWSFRANDGAGKGSRAGLSVPSSSGNTLQRGHEFTDERGGRSLSVPSSSGNTLQPLFIPRRFNDLQAAFYQIFRNGLICRKTRQVCENTNRMCVRTGH